MSPLLLPTSRAGWRRLEIAGVDEHGLDASIESHVQGARPRAAAAGTLPMVEDPVDAELRIGEVFRGQRDCRAVRIRFSAVAAAGNSWAAHGTRTRRAHRELAHVALERQSG